MLMQAQVLQDLPQEQPAEVLASVSRLHGGSRAVQELYEYMNQLEIQGIGLVEATQRCPLIGEIIGARCSRSSPDTASLTPLCTARPACCCGCTLQTAGMVMAVEALRLAIQAAYLS